jgi:hypothetical protein
MQVFQLCYSCYLVDGPALTMATWRPSRTCDMNRSSSFRFETWSVTTDHPALGHVHPPPPGFRQPSMISSTNLATICNAFLLVVSLVPTMSILHASMLTHLRIRRAQLKKTIFAKGKKKTPGAVFPRPQDSDIPLSSCAALPWIIARALDHLFQRACVMHTGSLCHSQVFLLLHSLLDSFPACVILFCPSWSTPSHHHATFISIDVAYRATHIHRRYPSFNCCK